jgi:hypothetical protein
MDAGRNIHTYTSYKWHEMVVVLRWLEMERWTMKTGDG